MGLKIDLSWYDKKTEEGVGEEYSRDLRDDCSVIEKLGLPVEVNNGEFNLNSHWINIIQPYFKHQIQSDKYDYQISFVYREEWPKDNERNNQYGP